jgi:hypothetical protein
VSNYLLWVNDDGTILVRWWTDNRMEIATRPDSDAVWGPPVELRMERVTA